MQTNNDNLNNAITTESLLAEFLESDENKRLYAESEIRFDLSARMKKMRKAKKLTQQDLAERVGCTQPFIVKLEQGAYDNFGLSTLRTYVRAMGYDISLDKMFTPMADAFYTGNASCKDMQEVFLLQEQCENRIQSLCFGQWGDDEPSSDMISNQSLIREFSAAA